MSQTSSTETITIEVERSEDGSPRGRGIPRPTNHYAQGIPQPGFHHPWPPYPRPHAGQHSSRFPFETPPPPQGVRVDNPFSRARDSPPPYSDPPPYSEHYDRPPSYDGAPRYHGPPRPPQNTRAWNPFSPTPWDRPFPQPFAARGPHWHTHDQPFPHVHPPPPSPGFGHHGRYHHPHRTYRPAHPAEPWPRRNRHGHSRLPMIDVDLRVRPEHVTFPSRNEMAQYMVSVFRPQVGVVARIVREILELPHRPRVHFGLSPVRVDNSTGGEPVLRPHHTSMRGPMFQITVPSAAITDLDSLQRVVDELKDEFAVSPNAWYRHAGFMFRTRRNTRARRRRYWAPPSIVYRFDRTLQEYVVRYVEPALEDIREVIGADGFGDETEDDQSDLVNDMWDDVRTASYFNRRRYM
ncbi:hypothetical protein GGS26DRAFT_604031 [Hypomontagnella submonticulosa]|nr:hypothetical protein GGS26DRAFT_604031 [Hypomontagnella submonticulosa]